MTATTSRRARRAGLLPASLGALCLLTPALAAAPALASPVPAAPLRCAAPDGVQAQADAADVVLSGTVTEVAPARSDRPQEARATYTVEVDRVWQGSVTRETVEVTAPSGARACGVTLTTGRRYVVFARADGSALSTDSRLGAGRATTALVADVEEVLGEGRAVGVDPTEPEPPVATAVDDSPPPDFGRTAAPGAALALVGLLGLLVVRRRAR